MDGTNKIWLNAILRSACLYDLISLDKTVGCINGTYCVGKKGLFGLKFCAIGQSCQQLILPTDCKLANHDRFKLNTRNPGKRLLAPTVYCITTSFHFSLYPLRQIPKQVRCGVIRRESLGGLLLLHANLHCQGRPSLLPKYHVRNVQSI